MVWEKLETCGGSLIISATNKKLNPRYQQYGKNIVAELDTCMVNEEVKLQQELMHKVFQQDNNLRVRYYKLNNKNNLKKKLSNLDSTTQIKYNVNNTQSTVSCNTATYEILSNYLEEWLKIQDITINNKVDVKERQEYTVEEQMYFFYVNVLFRYNSKLQTSANKFTQSNKNNIILQ